MTMNDVLADACNHLPAYIEMAFLMALMIGGICRSAFGKDEPDEDPLPPREERA